MALQTQTYEGTSGSSYWRYTVEVTENSTSVADNTSSVTAKVYLGRSNSASYMIGCSISGSVTINGTKKDYSYAKSSRVDVAVGQKSLLIATLNWTISHGSDGTKSVAITSSMTNNVAPVSGTLTSKTMTLTPIPRYATVTQSVNSKTETTITMKWTSDSTIDYIWYSTNNGSTWTGYNTADGTSGTYTISGLSANTTYNVKTRVRRKDSQLNTDSSKTSVATYNWPNPTGCPSFTIGSSVTISLYNPLSRSCTVTMTAGGNTIETKSGVTGTSTSGFNGSTTVSRLYAAIPSAKSGTYTITVTYSGHSLTKTGTFSINESSCTPSIGAVTVTDENATVTTITGSSSAIVQNKSSVRVKATSLSVKNSATISSVTFVYTGNNTARAMTVSGTTATANSTYTFANTSTTVTATITDSRGLKATKTLSVSVIPYSAPTANVSLKRENSYYTQTYLTVNAGASPVTVGGTAKNSIQTIVYATKRADSGTYSADTSIANNTQVTFPTEFDNQYAWDFRIKVTDRFQTTTVTVQLPRGIPLVMFDRKRNSVGVNAIPGYDNYMQVGGEGVYVEGNNTYTRILNIHPQDMNDANSSQIRFRGGSDTSMDAMIFASNTTNGVVARSYRVPPNASNYEQFRLPLPDASGANATYDILTTKTVQRGYIALSANKSVPSGTITNILELDMESGVYLFSAHLQFAAASGGTYRALYVGTATSGDSAYNAARVIVPPVQSTSVSTVMVASGILTNSSARTLYLNAVQNSGAALNAVASYTKFSVLRMS